MDKEEVMKEETFLLMLKPVPPNAPLPVSIGNASTCHTARRKTESEKKEVAKIPVLANGGGGRRVLATKVQ
jgi:hypothetical protein